MTSSERAARWAVFLALAAGTLAISGEVLRDPGRWGKYDWDYYFFQSFSVYRTLIEFGELPLWNPWYVGGVPGIGNFQAQFPSPWFPLDLVAGPVLAIKLKIVAHYAIGVAGMYWMARRLTLSRLASVYASGTFFFSTWLALRVHSGHLTYLSTAYLPYVVGALARSRTRPGGWGAIGAGGIVALMILQGGVYDVIFTAFVAALALAWSLQGRTVLPLATAVLIGVWGLGFSAVKLLPVVAYMRENPRVTGPGGASWAKYKDGAAPSAAGVAAEDGPGVAVVPRRGARSKWDLPAFGVKVFLGREQRSNRIYLPIQGYGWHEYGAYVGPLAVLLAPAAAWLAWRSAWPWLGAAALCFATGMGNFAPLAPWTLIHRLPVFKSMHAPGRLLTPCIFAASVAAGYGLDAIRRRLGGSGSRPRPVDWVLGLLVAVALVDSVAVARHSIAGTFPSPPPTPAPRRASILTIRGEAGDMTRPMLANYCTADGYEPIEPNVRVKACEEPGYRGELYFVPTATGPAVDRVELVGWTPNTVVVRASCRTSGHVVLNRNWAPGWRADPPYRAGPFEGLIAARVGPGDHAIRFVYRPSALPIGAGVSLLSLTAAVAVLIRTRMLRRVGTIGTGGRAAA